MSDLIERLRDESSRQKDWADEGESIVVGNGPELLLQAADEIERLRDRLAETKNLLRVVRCEFPDHSWQAREIDALAALEGGNE